MIRQAVRGLVVLTGMVLLVDSATGRQGITDKLVVRDKKDGSTKDYQGTVKYGPGGIQVVSGEKILVTVSPADVVKFIPGENSHVGIERSQLNGTWSLEDKKTKGDYEKALVNYQEMAKKTGLPDKTKQYLAFKIASLTSKIADESGDDEGWDKLADAAVNAWAGFLGDYKTGWELWPAAKANGRLYTELNKFAQAAQMWKQLTAKDVELPADLKQDALLREIDANIRSGKFSIASSLADAQAGVPAGSVKDKLTIYSRAAKAGDSLTPETLASAVKEIEDKIAATKDPTVRAVGYSMLGELYLAAKRTRDAMWSYLWVETVYNQDKDEALIALTRLAQIFKLQMDEDREKVYREKIRRFRANF
jgi:hypothetical protein